MKTDERKIMPVFRYPREKGVREWHTINIAAESPLERASRTAIPYSETSDETVPTNHLSKNR